MPAKMTAWRSTFEARRRLFLDLLLILGSCLVCFLFFSEQWHGRGNAERQQSLHTMAAQLADSSYVPLAANNLVSLNVLTSQLAARPPVVGVRIERLDGSVASSAGEESALQVTAVVGADGGEAIGRVRIFSEALPGLPVWAFLLLLLVLLGLRVALDFFWQQLVPLSTRTWQTLREGRQSPDTGDRQAEPPVATPLEEVRLEVVVAGFERLEQRYTPTALALLLDEYGGLLRKAARVYDADGDGVLATGKTTFLLHHDSAAEAVFLSLCCARLLAGCADRLSRQRQQQGESCLSLGLLASLDAPEALRDRMRTKGMSGTQLLLAGDPGALSSRMTARLLEQWQQDDERWQLFTDIELAERYRELVEAQCANLMTAAADA